MQHYLIAAPQVQPSFMNGRQGRVEVALTFLSAQCPTNAASLVETSDCGLAHGARGEWRTVLLDVLDLRYGTNQLELASFQCRGSLSYCTHHQRGYRCGKKGSTARSVAPCRQDRTEHLTVISASCMDGKRRTSSEKGGDREVASSFVLPSIHQPW